MMLTKAQRLMVEDGFPPELFLTAEQREQAWRDNPPRPFGQISDPKDEARKQLEQAIKAEANRKRDIRLSNLRAKKQREKIDTTGMRWDARRCKFVPDHSQPKEDQTMKWNVACFDASGALIQKGTTTIPASSSPEDVQDAIARMFHRCDAGSVQRIAVTAAEGQVISEWTAGIDADPDKPAAKKPAPSLDKTIKKAAAKGAKRGEKAAAKGKTATKGKTAAKGKAPKAAKSADGSGVGVIGSIIELARRSEGATIEEFVKALKKRFPDRDEKSMTGTVRTQVGRQKMTKTEDAKRGVVYRMPK